MGALPAVFTTEGAGFSTLALEASTATELAQPIGFVLN
jgi:hypothetical protein